MSEDDERSSATPGRDAREQLRARGLRVTPQRRAILGAFAGAGNEHLSADEVHARASAAVPELSRGTVYATLAELAELGLLGAVGSPEAVRYEANLAEHAHFRCRSCLRLYDVELRTPDTGALTADGFVVERAAVTAEGVCVDCARYAEGLSKGVRQLHGGARVRVGIPDQVACSEVDSPVGTLTLGATAAGVVRVAYEEHGDVPDMRARIRSRRGSRRAREHLASAQAVLDAYFAGDRRPPECPIDWAALPSVSPLTLQAATRIGYAEERSYDDLGTDAPPHRRGLALGANPLAILVPCHRVNRGRDVPEAYIGGPQRRRFLRDHEHRPAG